MPLTEEQKWGVGVGAVGAIGGVVAGVWAIGKANEAKTNIQTLQKQIEDLEAQRPPIVNPYAEITNVSGMLSNEYRNLGVAMKATNIQIQESDIALANTLDTLRATGAGAGGATALAQAALRSKNNIAANLEQQEVANQKLRAQGEMAIQQAKMTEEQRVQQARASGTQYVYEQADARMMQQLNRTQAFMDQERANQIAFNTQAMTAFGASISSLGQVAGGLATGN
jgi:polyhydroxyalkanoate synthesis regulator phasin